MKDWGDYERGKNKEKERKREWKEKRDGTFKRLKSI